jgi:D-sedoheptulose 7-phosphate isomerase
MDEAARAQHAGRVLREAAAAHERAAAGLHESIAKAAHEVASALRSGGTVLAFGNGGSAADAQHFVAELVGRYEAGRSRRAWPALALSADSSVVTAVANDMGFERVFARQIEALGRKGDVALAISTSGSSANVLRGLEAARDRGMATIALTGPRGDAGPRADVHLAVQEQRTPRIQEVHATVLHILCELVEAELVDYEGHEEG